jgi:NADPH:quinone reductase-like Zn-dependent oxidoreductase
MRAMVFDRYGEPDVMSLREEPVPEPQDGEVLIRVGFAGVNPSDSRLLRAGYRVRDFKFPFVAGMDAAGVVERTGSNNRPYEPRFSWTWVGRRPMELISLYPYLRTAFAEGPTVSGE